MRRSCTYFDDNGVPLTDGALLLYATWIPTSGEYIGFGHVNLDDGKVIEMNFGVAPRLGGRWEYLDDLIACVVVDSVPDKSLWSDLLKHGVEGYLCKRWNCTMEDLYKRANEVFG